jgi:hypothetical protein
MTMREALRTFSMPPGTPIQGAFPLHTSAVLADFLTVSMDT